MKPVILIVDGGEAIRCQMQSALSNDYDMCFAEDRVGAVEAFETMSPAVTLLDLGPPPRPNECDEGIAWLPAFWASDTTPRVFVISGGSKKKNATKASGAGAYFFVGKPLDMDT